MMVKHNEMIYSGTDFLKDVDSKSKKIKPLTYKKWEYHDDAKYYWVSVLCKNCYHDSQLGVLKGVEINKSRLKFIRCFRCEVKGKLSLARWDGGKYVEQ